MNTLRNLLVSALTRLIAWLSTARADTADLYFCYRLLLQRMPDKEGWELHRALLRTGCGRRALVEGFLNSDEFAMLWDRSSTAQRIEADGFSIWLDADDPLLTNAILHDGQYEPHVTRVLRQELAADSVFVDVGANMGWFSLLAASLSPQGHVIAVEPNHFNTQLLQRSILTNSFENLRVFPYAAGDKQELLQLDFFHSNGYIAETRVDVPKATSQFVQAMPLDSLLGGEDRIDLLKMDIEGYEPIALAGMQQSLERCRPVILTEFNPLLITSNGKSEPEAYLDALQAMGYAIHIIQEDGAQTLPLNTGEVMAAWRRLNRRKNADGEYHLDLVARPQ